MDTRLQVIVPTRTEFDMVTDSCITVLQSIGMGLNNFPVCDVAAKLSRCHIYILLPCLQPGVVAEA